MRNLPTVASSTNECDIGYIFFFGFMLCCVRNFEMTKSSFIFLQKNIYFQMVNNNFNTPLNNVYKY